MKLKEVTLILLLAASLLSCQKKPAKSTEIISTETKKVDSVIKDISHTPTDNVTLDVKIGQMIMVGINDRKVLLPKDSLLKELSDNKIGGIILFEKNISKDDSKVTLLKLTTDLQNHSKFPLFISIDEEGGKVHRLKEKYGFVSMPSAAYLGTLPSPDSTFYYAERLANQLKGLGININFAPVVDVSLNPSNTVIVKAGRSYSDKPEVVAKHASAFIKAHRSKNIGTTLKHFPGHGSSASDTHKGLVDVTKQWQFKELFPYKTLFEEGEVDGIISCHVINCHLDTTCVPSTLSRIVTTEILRNVLGFKGVVFSDDMQMYAISKNYGLQKSIVMAINAGVDVLVFGNNVNQTDRIKASEIHAVIKNGVLKGEISESRINEAYARIWALKSKISSK